MMNSDFINPVTGNLDVRLKASFGPAAAAQKNFYRLKPGELRDEILQKRDEAVASVIKLQSIADQAGITLEDWSGQYFLAPLPKEKVPQGWENVVIHSSAPRECLPKDAAAYDEISTLREKAYWRPLSNVEDDVDNHIFDMSSGLKHREEFLKASDARKHMAVELIGDDVYIQTPAQNTFAFPNWEKCRPADYYAAVAQNLAQQDQPPPVAAQTLTPG
jgi:hypothetical protein